MQILLTGAAGQIASSLVPALMEDGHDVVAVDRIVPPGLAYSVIKADLRDSTQVNGLLNGCEVVIHLASTTGYCPVNNAELVVSENSVMSANIFCAAARERIGCLINASCLSLILGLGLNNQGTTFRSDGPAYLPMDGFLPPRLWNSSHSLSKLQTEELLRFLARNNSELSVINLRLPAILSDEEIRQMRNRTARGTPSLPTLESETEAMHNLLTYLPQQELNRLMLSLIHFQLAGYHSYLPAMTYSIPGSSPSQIVSQYFDVPQRKGSIAACNSWVDLERITLETNWSPIEKPLDLFLHSEFPTEELIN